MLHSVTICFQDSYQVEFDHGWGELDKDAEHTEIATKRLAVCNLDWDRIEATDLMVLFNSFLPSGGLIHSVTVSLLLNYCLKLIKS